MTEETPLTGDETATSAPFPPRLVRNPAHLTGDVMVVSNPNVNSNSFRSVLLYPAARDSPSARRPLPVDLSSSRASGAGSSGLGRGAVSSTGASSSRSSGRPRTGGPYHTVSRSFKEVAAAAACPGTSANGRPKMGSNYNRGVAGVGGPTQVALSTSSGIAGGYGPQKVVQSSRSGASGGYGRPQATPSSSGRVAGGYGRLQMVPSPGEGVAGGYGRPQVAQSSSSRGTSFSEAARASDPFNSSAVTPVDHSLSLLYSGKEDSINSGLYSRLPFVGVRPEDAVVPPASGAADRTVLPLFEGPSAAEETVVYTNPDYERALSDGQASGLVTRQDGYDFRIHCSGKLFQVHLTVLACFTDYFQCMVRSNMVEAQVGEVILEDMDPQALELLISYMYTGRMSLTWNSAQHLLSIAMRLNVSSVLTIASNHLMQTFHVDRASDLVRLVDMYPVDPLEGFLQERLIREFVSFAGSPSLTALPVEKLCVLLSLDSLCTLGEGWLLKRALEWIEETGATAEDVSAVLGHIRFGLLTDEDLEVARTSLVVKTNTDAKNMVTAAFQYVEACHYRHPIGSLATTMTRLRTSETCLILTVNDDSIPFGLFACRLGGGAKGVGIIQPPPVDNGNPPPPPSRRAVEAASMAPGAPQIYKLYADEMNSKALGAVSFDNFLFVFTCVNLGVMEVDRTVELRRFDPRRLSMTQMQPMAVMRDSFATVLCGRYIYVIGGRTMAGPPTSIVERYSIDDNKWSRVPRLVYATAFCAAASTSTSVVITGGCSMSDLVTTNIVLQLDTESMEWSVLRPMNYYRRSHDMSIINNKVYVIGGVMDDPYFTRKVPVEMYTFETNQWTIVTGYTSLGGSSLGHYVSLPGTSDLFVVGRECAVSEEQDVWRLHMDPREITITHRWANLPHKLSASFTSTLELNFDDEDVIRRQIGGPPNVSGGFMTGTCPYEDSHRC